MKIDKYLNFLNEGKDYKDPSLPNPYDYQSLDLDPNVTSQDIKIIGEWLKKNKKFYPPDRILHPYNWLYYDMEWDPKKDPEVGRKESEEVPYIIVDNGKRVGMVKIHSWSGSITWISWVPGHNYATRGVMKLFDNILSDKSFKNRKIRKNILKLFKIGRIGTTINKENKPSIKVAEKLKMVLKNTYGGNYKYELKYPPWWLKI